MQTNNQTTCILLERGTEDRELWNELNKVIIDLKIKSIRAFIKRYPLLNELKQSLKEELDIQDE